MHGAGGEGVDVEAAVVMARRGGAVGDLDRAVAGPRPLEPPRIFREEPTDERFGGAAEALKHGAERLGLLTGKRRGGNLAGRGVIADVLAAAIGHGGVEERLLAGEQPEGEIGEEQHLAVFESIGSAGARRRPMRPLPFGEFLENLDHVRCRSAHRSFTPCARSPLADHEIIRRVPPVLPRIKAGFTPAARRGHRGGAKGGGSAPVGAR